MLCSVHEVCVLDLVSDFLGFVFVDDGCLVKLDSCCGVMGHGCGVIGGWGGWGREGRVSRKCRGGEREEGKERGGKGVRGGAGGGAMSRVVRGRKWSEWGGMSERVGACSNTIGPSNTVSQ